MKKTIRGINIQIQKVFARHGQPVTTDVKVDLLTDIPGYTQVVETHSDLGNTDAIIEAVMAALPEKLAHGGAFEVAVAEEPPAPPAVDPLDSPLSAGEIAGDVEESVDE
tara:strand:+ start:314 stop:640 length:327 start_codon:yes stop_codon:yes gene_type:complete